MNIEDKIKIKDRNGSHSFNKDQPTLYKTSDLYLSAFLKAKGIFLQKATWENGRVVFIFQDPGDIQKLIAEYFNDSRVGVLTYKATLRDLRTIIFEYKDRRGLTGESKWI